MTKPNHMAGLFNIGGEGGIPRRVAARPFGAAGVAGRASRPLAARLIAHGDLALSRVLTRRTGPIKTPHQNGAFLLAEREGYLAALRLAPSGLPALPAGRRGHWPLGTNPVEGSHPPKRALKMTKPNRMAGLFNIGGEGGIRTLGGIAPTTVFETVPFNHSGTSPRAAAIISAKSASATAKTGAGGCAADAGC